MAIHAVLFDHDGTIVDSEPTHHQMWNSVLAHHGVELTETQYKDWYAGMPTAANAIDIQSRFALDVVPAALAQAKNDATTHFLSRQPFPLMPGTHDVLVALQQLKLRLGVVTGAGASAVQATLRLHGLQAFFETVVSADDVEHSKPAPDCYLLAARHLGLQPAQCVAIEDTEHGLNAAAAAGVPCIAIPTDMSRHHDFSKATVVVPRLAEALEWISHRAAAA